MKNALLLWLLCSLPLWTAAQLQDDFSDGDLTDSPAWLGDIDRFQVNGGELQLFHVDPDANNVSTLYLPAPTSLNAETVWECLVRLEFAPSSSNYAQLFLQASEPDLQADQFGYFLRVGGISGADDAIELYRQDGAPGNAVLLLSASAGAVGGDPALARIRVVRSVAGQWDLWADYSGGTDLQLEGSAQDDTYAMGGYFGCVCRYTSTRSEAFFFDDVLVDPLFMDVTPPTLLSAEALDATTVLVQFDEALDAQVATDPTRYELDGGIGAPASVLADADPSQVRLVLGTALANMTEYTLQTDGISDLSGNMGSVQTTSFTFLALEEALPFDVLINEIMADPSPPLLLPEAEYIELYNRSDKAIELEDWTFTDGGTPHAFPPYVLMPDSFLIVCDPEEAAAFSDRGATLGLEGFPALNNAGDDLQLYNAFGELIHRVPNTDQWYRESDKDEGGWSLELINPAAPCGGAENWRASENLGGGTPGRPNSVLASAPDDSGPTLLTIFPDSPTRLTLTFQEALDPVPASDPSQYLIDGGAVEVIAAEQDPSPSNVVTLTLLDSLEAGRIYFLMIDAGLTDCVGNPIGEELVQTFGLPVQPQPGEILINELLYLPEVGGKDYLELYNASGRLFNIGDLVIGNIVGSSDSIAPVTVDRLFFPATYLVLTEDPSDVLARYTVLVPEQVLQNDLPVFPDRSGNVTLYTAGPGGEPLVVDAFDYSDELHNPLLDETRGVSLERVDPGSPTQSAANWQSAAAASGYGTPTARNSQYLPYEGGASGAISLPYTTFSPDGDGYRDFLSIDYALDQPGYVATARIYDANGRLVKELASGELLGTEGSFRWEGDRSDGQRARIGIYVAWVEWTNPQIGKVEQTKKACVLARRLE